MLCKMNTNIDQFIQTNKLFYPKIQTMYVQNICYSFKKQSIRVLTISQNSDYQSELWLSQKVYVFHILGMCISLSLCRCIYIYIERERERERGLLKTLRSFIPTWRSPARSGGIVFFSTIQTSINTLCKHVNEQQRIHRGLVRRQGAYERQEGSQNVPDCYFNIVNNYRCIITTNIT